MRVCWCTQKRGAVKSLQRTPAQRGAMLRALVHCALVIAYAACAPRSLWISLQTPRAWPLVHSTRAASGVLWVLEAGNQTNCSQARRLPRLPRRFKTPPLKRTDTITDRADVTQTWQF